MTPNLSAPALWASSFEEIARAFAVLRAEEPVSWQDPPLAWASSNFPPPRGYWAVTRHADVVGVSRNTEDFASGDGVMLFDNVPEHLRYPFEGFIGLDAPRHMQLRRLVAKAFSPAAVGRLEATVTDLVRRKIARVAPAGGCDFHTDLVALFPTEVMCMILGADPADAPELVRLMQLVNGFGVEATTFDDSIAAAQAITDYGMRLADERRASPRPDLLTALVSAQVEGQPLDDEDIGATFFVILSGGVETVTATASHGLVALSRAPDQRTAWQRDFDRMAPTAVEEILRVATPVHHFRRVARRDVLIGEREVKAGDNVVVWYLSANRDHSAFAQPERLDLTRSPNPHVALGGGGPHFCLGASLARLQLRVLFRELFERLPDIEIDGEPRSVHSPFMNAFTHVPCRFEARRQ